MIILGGSYYNGPKSIFTGTAIIKDVNKIVLQNGIYDRLYVSNDISKQEIVDTYTSEAAKSVKIESGINRIETIDVYGKTTQEGTGDASPDNVREIENAGMYNAVVTINGSEPNWILISVNDKTVRADVQNVFPGIFFMQGDTKNRIIGSTIKASKTTTDESDTVHIRSSSNEQSKATLCIYMDKSKLAEPTDEAMKQYFSAHPLTIAYQSTTDTGEFYTGIEITQGDEYRCEIIELQAPLHEGDKVETNVQSEYDKSLLIDGSQDFSGISPLSSVYRLSLYSIALDLQQQDEQLSSDFKYIFDFERDDEHFYIHRPSGNLYIFISKDKLSDGTRKSAKQYFKNNPCRFYYKSTSGGTGKNVRRETHNSKTRIITGTENGILFNPKYNSLSIKVDNLAGDKSQEQVPGIVKSSHFKTNAAVNGILAQPKYNQVTILSASVFDSTESAKAYFAQQYAAGTPVTIEYELAQPEVFADELVIVENKAGEYTVSFESTGRVKLKPVINQEGWSDDTIIDAGFNGDLAGGNVDFTAESIDKIRIKRRKKGTANWVDLKDIIINVPDDFTFTFYDLFAANAAEYTYAVVPVIGDIEGNLSTVDIQSMFNGFFIADKNTIYGTEYNVNVGAATKNEKSSVVQTLGAKYPFIIDNGYNNYYTVPISLFFYNPNLDWQQNVQYRQMIVEWLHNGTAKIFKSEDGRIWLAKVTTAPVLTPGSNLNITSIDFSITEIGESNSTEDLYNSGLLSLIKES